MKQTRKPVGAVNISKKLPIGIAIGLLLGFALFWVVADHYQVWINPQNQLNQQQSNNMYPSSPSLTSPISVSGLLETGKALQIQSVTNGQIYVQNVGDRGVILNSSAVYVDGVSVNVINVDPVAIMPGDVNIYHLIVPISSGFHTVRVISSDGTFSEVSKNFS